MLKAKNILIIFMLNYLIMLFVCCVIEFIMISSNAQQIHIMVTTAADMALEQVQATDDYFTSGEGYIISSTGSLESINHPYKMKVLGRNGKYKEVNIFEAVCNTTDFSSIYNQLYNSSKIQDYINNTKGDVLDVDFIAGTYTMDATNFNANIISNYYRIPVLAQLGDVTHGSMAKRVTKLNGSPETNTTVIDELWKNYDLRNQGKLTNVNGVESLYYYTPLSVGLTYINEELLQAFFMNNLELLMRGKYEKDSSYNLALEKYGNGMLKTSMYPDLVDTESLKNENPINNGYFTLLRGKKISTDSSVYMYEGIKPKIEYMVIDMYNDSYNGILQSIIGPKTTKENTGGLSNTSVTVTGTNLKKMNSDQITGLANMTGSSRSLFESKAVVVAKVTFYAEFILPYNTPLLREMRGRIKNGEEMSGRYLLNPFAGSSIDVNNVSAINENYVDIVTNNEGADSLGSNSIPYSYTTYFAVIQ